MIDPALLQLFDGLFPSGGFAHSLGLETLAAEGRVRDRAGLEAFLAAHLEGAAGPCDAVALVRAMRDTADIERCFEIDAELDAMKPARPLREASAQMGRQTLRVVASLRTDPSVRKFHEAAEAGATPGHHAVALGLAAAALGLAEEDAATAYLQSTATLLVSAGVRLLGLGQVDGQRALFSLRETVRRLAREALAAPDMTSFAPALEAAAMRHVTLDARLFRS